MIENFLSAGNVNFLLVFLAGALSFFSPCVIPLIPIYMSYLAGNARQVLPDGRTSYRRGKVFLHTLFFVLGVSFAFFLLGLSFSALGKFFHQYQTVISTVGGCLIVVLGLYQLGVFRIGALERERRVHIKLNFKKMNPLLALVMGFTFSFAWTPCVGPALSSVLIMASSADTALAGNVLVLVYALGFVIPFLILGLFTAGALNLLERHKKALKYTVKAGGVILVLMGLLTITGFMNGISGFLSGLGSGQDGVVEQTQPAEQNPPSAQTQPESQTPAERDPDAIPAFDFTLTDQYGNSHTLSDYKGKVVFLNFWATWCPPCQQEMPHIEELYREYGENTGDVIFLGVVNPKSDRYPQSQDVAAPEITAFIQQKGYTFPTVFDESGEVFGQYQISAFPTTFMIDKNGDIYGYVPGALTKAQMEDIIQQTIEGKR